jgi:hypothetical protein
MDVVALVALMMLSGLIAFHGTVPDDLQWWFVAGGVLAALGIGGLMALILFGDGIRQRLPERVRPHYERLEDGIVTSFARGRFPSIVALTVSIWMLEGIRVFAVTQALDVSLTFQACIFVALLASLLTTFPITPAGLGAVESGTIVALTLFDVGDSQAGAVALIDRGIAYWSVILFGGLLYLVSRHK